MRVTVKYECTKCEAVWAVEGMLVADSGQFKLNLSLPEKVNCSFCQKPGEITQVFQTETGKI